MSSSPTEYFIYYIDANGLNGVRWQNNNTCAVYYKNSLVENHENMGFQSCINQAKTHWSIIIEEIKKPIEEVQICAYPDYDGLFSAIYLLVPIIFGCGLAIKILNKVFNTAE